MILPVRPPRERPIPCLQVPLCAGCLLVCLHDGEGGTGEELIGHVSRDSTATEGREAPKPAPVEKPKRKCGRLERQLNGMSRGEMLVDLPSACDHGARKNAKGFLVSWRGYKLHLDTADCGVPASAIMTSASVHDNQVAIPLATMTARRRPTSMTSWTRPVMPARSTG